MLTRLKVDGFKNLVNTTLDFGPFTCIAGANGVGKSNLFDAIQFLSALSDRPLIDAALSVRDEGARTTDLRSLFHRRGNEYAPEITFDAEMIIPQAGIDDLGLEAKATITFLRYTLTLIYHPNPDSSQGFGRLEIRREELTHIQKGKARSHLRFPHHESWRKTAVIGERRVPFISTQQEGEDSKIRLHQDGGSSGRAQTMLAKNLPRTVLSSTNAAENPTALLAKREMQSWRILQLEPSSLRRPDQFMDSSRLSADGSHLPATLYRLARSHEEETYTQVANKLSELIDDVDAVMVDRDEKRELLTIQVTDRGGTIHPARALSDGTLRFLALAVLDLDPEEQTLICLEEPENGIHPKRIEAILSLLQSIATKPFEAIGPQNPLRQVIINTHSPSVVQQIDDDSLIVAESKENVSNGQHFKSAHFSCLTETWRTTTDPPASVIAKGSILNYLNPVLQISSNGKEVEQLHNSKKPSRRVIDREDIRPLIIPGLEMF